MKAKKHDEKGIIWKKRQWKNGTQSLSNHKDQMIYRSFEIEKYLPSRNEEEKTVFFRCCCFVFALKLVSNFPFYLLKFEKENRQFKLRHSIALLLCVRLYVQICWRWNRSAQSTECRCQSWKQKTKHFTCTDFLLLLFIHLVFALYVTNHGTSHTTTDLVNSKTLWDTVCNYTF